MKRRLLLLLLLAPFFAPWTAFGQQLTVYDGNDNSYTVPAYILYFDDFARSQFVIPASDLTAMNGKSIQSMTFYTTIANIPYTTVSSADVYLKEVDYTAISTFEPKANASIVYSGTFDIVSEGDGGTLTINFSSNFTYHGGNLLVGIENTEDNGFTPILFHGQSVDGASISGYNANSLDAVQPSQQNFIPKTTFTFAEELTVYDGTTINAYVPAYIYYFDDFTRSQFVIPASQLAEMYNTPVTSMTFYTTTSGVPYTTASSANVYIKEVSYTTINSFASFGSSDLRYQGYFNIVSTPEGGKMTINFSTPFTYHGNNLLVGIENTEDFGYSNVSFYGQSVEGASVAGYDANSLNAVQPIQRNFIPKTTFGFIPNCDPVPLPYSCGFESLDEIECWTKFELDYWSPIVDEEGIGGSSCYSFVPDQLYQQIISPKLEGTTDIAMSLWLQAIYVDTPETLRVGYSTNTKSLADFTWREELTVYRSDQWMLYEDIFPQGTKYVAIQYTNESIDAGGLLIDDFNVVPSFCPFEDQCQLTFELTDDYGDSWNGASIRVVDVESNVVLATLTNENLNGVTGYGTDELNTHTLAVCDGRELRFEWVNGSWDNECSYIVTDVNGIEIFSGSGAMSAPVTYMVNCAIVQMLALSPGANWVSFNMEITLDDLKAALVEAVPNTEITIQDQNNNVKYNPNTHRWTGRLTELDLSKMYKISVAAGCTLTLEGTVVNPDNHPATIGFGANWIAFPLREEKTPSEAFAGFAQSGDKLQSQTQNASYNGTRWNGQLNTLEPGQGYIYQSGVSEDRVFSFAQHDYVDLGLPSGTLWATCNVGAASPEGYGDYFAWGETTTKSDYSWSTYQYCNGSQNTLTKYCNNSSYGYNGFTDNLTTLLPEDDAATANWGSDWRMPTKEEWQELLDNTTVTWTTQNGVYGRLFTAPNGNSLFLPAAGCRYDSSLNNAGSNGLYWSSSLGPYGPYIAWDFSFASGYYGMANYYGRNYGFTVRPVRSSQTEHAYVDLGLPSGTQWATCNVGADSPEDYGDYFAWGETTPKETYNWSNYQHCNGSSTTLTKYCDDASYGYNGFTDDLTTLLPEDDAATANWGSGWRMPTKEEWQELYDNTTQTWTTQNGVNGRLFTAANGNSLFLPAAGRRWGSELNYAGSNGYYWSHSLYTDYPINAWYLSFYSGGCSMYNGNRDNGFTVRPVREN